MDTIKFFLSEEAHEPIRAHKNDAGIDLKAINNVTIPPGKSELISTGVKTNLPENTVGLICSRSSLAVNHNIFVLNAPGIIDEGYEGEIKIILYNLSQNPYQITKGEKVAQLVIVPTYYYQVITQNQTENIHKFSTTGRNENGFGSTGTH